MFLWKHNFIFQNKTKFIEKNSIVLYFADLYSLASWKAAGFLYLLVYSAFGNITGPFTSGKIHCIFMRE